MIRSYLTSHSFQKCNTDLSIANKQNFLLEYFIADAFPDNAIFKISLSSNITGKSITSSDKSDFG